MDSETVIYTDGGCDPNPGPGGWAALIIHNKKLEEISGAELVTTNNRMELTAAIEGLRWLRNLSVITLYTDSQYLQKGIEVWMAGWLRKNWRGSSGPVANKELWQELLAESQRHQVTWRWLRGHAGNPYNERVDRLCRMARNQLKNHQLGH